MPNLYTSYRRAIYESTFRWPLDISLAFSLSFSWPGTANLLHVFHVWSSLELAIIFCMETQKVGSNWGVQTRDLGTPTAFCSWHIPTGRHMMDVSQYQTKWDSWIAYRAAVTKKLTRLQEWRATKASYSHQCLYLEATVVSTASLSSWAGGTKIFRKSTSIANLFSLRSLVSATEVALATNRRKLGEDQTLGWPTGLLQLSVLYPWTTAAMNITGSLMNGGRTLWQESGWEASILNIFVQVFRKLTRTRWISTALVRAHPHHFSHSQRQFLWKLTSWHRILPLYLLFAPQEKWQLREAAFTGTQ